MDPNEVGRFFLLHCDEARHAAFLVDKLQTTFKQGKFMTISSLGKLCKNSIDKYGKSYNVADD